MKLPCRRLPLLAVGCGLAAFASLASTSAYAEPAPAYEILLQQISLTPTSAEADALLEAAEARVRQARVRPNPVLGLEAENIFGGGPFNGYGNAETTLSVSQDLELWGRRNARVRTAQAQVGVSSLRRELSRVEASARLALAYAEAEVAERRHHLAAEALTVTLEDTRAILILIEEGREPMLRGLQGESEAAAARATLDEAEAERDAAFARLTAVAMLPASPTSIEAGLIDRLPVEADMPSSVTLHSRIAEAERSEAENRIAVEHIRARPDVTATVGFRRYEAEDTTAMTFGLSLPLPLFDRNRGNVEAAQADLRAADARLMGVNQQIRSDRDAARARLRASASRVSASDAGIRASEEAYRLSRIGFEAGRISQLELRASRTALISSRNAAVDARLARVRAEVDLARLQGRAPFESSK